MTREEKVKLSQNLVSLDRQYLICDDSGEKMNELLLVAENIVLCSEFSQCSRDQDELLDSLIRDVLVLIDHQLARC